MNFFAWSSIITSFLAFAVGFLVLYKNRRRLLNITWFLTSVSIGVWSFSLFKVVTSKVYISALAWQHILDISAIFLPIFFFHFTLVLLKFNKKSIRRYKIIIFTSYLIACLLAIFSFTSLFKLGVIKTLDFNYWINPGVFYPIFPCIFLTYILLSLFLLVNGYKYALGVDKGQIKYVLIGMIVGFTGGSTNFLPQLMKIYPIGNYFVLFYIIFIAYAISRYRLMDIRLIILRSITFGVIISLITIIFAGVSGIVATLFQDLIGSKSNIISGLIVGILVSIGYQPLRRLIEYSTNRLLYKKRYDPDELLSKINSITSSILNLSQLLKSASEILVGTFHSSKFSVALLDKNNKLKLVYHEGFNGTIEKFTAGKEKILNLYFKDSRDIQVIDEMKARFEAGEYQPKNVELLSALYEMDIALIIPLFAKEELTGIIAVGNKKSGDPYNQQDLNIWKIISGQLAVAIENARLYDELKKFNINLQQKVDDATQELRNANRSLREMDQMKSDFISIASHQLRTPLTVIKGYISMIQEGSFGKVSPVITEQLGKVYQSNERLIGLVENLLDISRIESGRQEFDWISIDFSKLAATVVDNLKQNAKNKNIRLSFIKPKSPVPQVIADKKIHEVMMNFVDNAIKYTKAGKIEVSVAAQPAGMVTFSVKDTGRGVTKQGMEYLFKKFSRGKGSFQVHTEGLGLGLFVAKMLIDAHHGVIGVESAGVDKGAKFFFSIPLDGPKSKIKPSEPICRYLGE